MGGGITLLGRLLGECREPEVGALHVAANAEGRARRGIGCAGDRIR